MGAKRHILIFLISAAFIYNGCTKDNVEDFYNCDTEDVSYANDIVPIMVENCYLSCHAGSSPSSGFNLETYSSLSTYTDTTTSVGAPLLCFIKQENTACEDFWMPDNSGPIAPCSINKIEAWISSGAPNN